MQKFNLNGNEEYFKNLLKQVKIGSIVPLYKVINKAIDPEELFAKLSDYGRKPNSVFLESAAIVQKYGENSIGSSDPCLKLSGKGNSFKIIAFNELGEHIINFIKNDFGFCDSIKITKKEINGTLKPQRKNVPEEDRIKLITHIDIIRNLAFKFQPIIKPFVCYGGLFGVFSYDFIDQFEDLPKYKEDILNENDYDFYFLDNLFYVDHQNKKTYFVANAIKLDDNHEQLFEQCLKKIENYEKIINEKILFNKQTKKLVKQKISSDVSKIEYIQTVDKIKEEINQGNIFQCVFSRTIMSNYNSEPYDIYKRLKKLNPSPYMFYNNFGGSILLGASPEMNLRVQGTNDKKFVEIRPIAGTKPRGLVNGRIDAELDLRYEIEIKTDEKEVAEHTMLIDLARNDIARISVPGSRIVDETYVIEKYSHVQHLVSNVKGILKPDLDCLHAYLGTMNMGTLTGAPKVNAMQLLRNFEKTKRGYYGGAVTYITPSKDMDSCIVIRSMTLKNDKAYVRAGAGIVFDSVSEKEFMETEKKAMACIKVLEGDFND